MSFEPSQPCVHLQECVATNTQVINPADKKKKRWNFKGEGECRTVPGSFMHAAGAGNGQNAEEKRGQEVGITY